LIAARNKEVKIRPLDRDKISAEKLQWQLINLILPVVLMIAFGVIKSLIRRKKFASF
jgi:ABC-2 type transport system permease protein